MIMESGANGIIKSKTVEG
ncbi:hypothetical protein PV393_15530 [Oceanobacillus oncorhynchi subsp. incaldanensis]|nr:hypothetical protein [Oceanobacillus oncorhynchi]